MADILVNGSLILSPSQLHWETSRGASVRSECWLNPGYKVSRQSLKASRPEKKLCTPSRVPNSKHAPGRLILSCSLATSSPSSGLPAESYPSVLPTVSVVIPVYNEVGAISILVERIGDALTRSGWPHEVICVDDGSSDGTPLLLKAMAAEKPELRVVILRRNFGQTAAMAAGFDFASGDLVVTLDGDLQNDPDDIPRLLDCLLYGHRADKKTLYSGQKNISLLGMERVGGGYDMVCGWRKNRKDDSLTRNLPSAIANKLIGALTGVKLRDYGCSLKAYRGSLARSLKIYGELHRYLPALAAMDGAAITELEVEHRARTIGQSKYNLGRVPRVLSDLCSVLFLARFRDRPMHLFGTIAFAGLLLSLSFFVCFWASASASAKAFGWAVAISSSFGHFVASLEFLMASVLVLCLGFVAEICMRTYYESQARSVYRVREVAN